MGARVFEDSGNFVWKEFASNKMVDGKKKRRVVPVPDDLRANVRSLVKNLEVLKAELGGVAVTIVSGWRTPAYNEAVDGADRSQHLEATAADIKVKGVSPEKVLATILRLIEEGRMEQGGVGGYATFTHYDNRGKRARWGG